MTGQMSDLIDRQAALDACHQSTNLFEAQDRIEELPSAEKHTGKRTETQTCDLIDRQAAIAALCHRCDLVAEDCEPCTSRCDDIKILEMMPSAQPDIAERSHESAQNMQKNDLISRKAAIDERGKTERKTGKWLPDTRAFQTKFVCSECKESLNVDTVNLKPKWKFCPCCGARMEGTE